MLRFVPDTWLDGLLRPVLLADSVAGLYSEMQAPDLRFLMLLLALAVLVLLRRGRPALSASAWRAMVALTLCFYVWTFVSGNSRYFLWGLILVGPLLVLVLRELPVTRALRNTLILMALLLQGFAVQMTLEPNTWALRAWERGPGLTLRDDPIRENPAVFITIGANSYSILVPQFHPQSRWTNIAGQQDLVPGMLEHARQQRLLAADLPRYAVVRAAGPAMSADLQPSPHAWGVIRRALAPSHLQPTPGHRCTFVRSDSPGRQFVANQPTVHGFWFCPVSGLEAPAHEASSARSATPQVEAAFAAIEARCPRFFPPGNAQTRATIDGFSRHYSQSDTVVHVLDQGTVHLKNLRAINPTELGRLSDVLAGRFTFDCERLPGRYLPPWARH